MLQRPLEALHRKTVRGPPEKLLREGRPPPLLVLPAGTVANTVEEQGAVQAVATPLFQAYLVPFEIASLMLLAAIVGAVVLAKRRV